MWIGSLREGVICIGGIPAIGAQLYGVWPKRCASRSGLFGWSGNNMRSASYSLNSPQVGVGKLTKKILHYLKLTEYL